jgi:arylsulfatase
VFANLQKSQMATKKPNIVIIWGDDMGQSNISAYSKGMMGYQTPNGEAVFDSTE